MKSRPRRRSTDLSKPQIPLLKRRKSSPQLGNKLRVQYVDGVNYLSVLSYKDKLIYNFGERHSHSYDAFRPLGCFESDDYTSINTLLQYNLKTVKNLTVLIEGKSTDEFIYKEYDTHDEYKYGYSALKLHPFSNEVDYGNNRIILTDLRKKFISSDFFYDYGYVFKPSLMELIKSLDVNCSRQMAKDAYKYLMETVNDMFARFIVMINIAYNHVHDKIEDILGEYIEEYTIIDQYISLESELSKLEVTKLVNFMNKFEKKINCNNIHEFLSSNSHLFGKLLFDAHMYIIDAYTLAHAMHPDNKNIIIYSGANHSRVYYDFFVEEGAIVLDLIESNEDQCLDISSIPQPFFN